MIEVFACVAVWNLARATQAALVVNTTDVGADGMCDASHCSLPDALAVANLTSGPDEIAFAIPPGDSGCDAAGVCTIRLQTALEELHDGGTTIDGFTQPGASPNTAAVGEAINAAFKVVLDGSAVPGCCATGVLITGSGCRVRGLVIHGFHTGIEVRDATDNRIDGNFVGTDAAGAVAVGNSCSGVSISGAQGGPGSSGNTLGGDAPEHRNLISGNGCVGVEIGPSGSNVVQGNYVGTDAAGEHALPNTIDGVYVFNASAGNLVGGAVAGAANLIAFNGGNGVTILGGFGVARATITRNRIAENTGKGIALVAGGNDGLPAPLITAVSPTQIGGTACAGCAVELFSTADDEGAIYEGTATTDGAGNWQVGIAAGLSGPYLTATATDALGNTSEFSPPVALAAGCIGDCESDGNVTIDELLRAVNIALGTLAIDLCPAIDRNGDGRAGIDELVAAVNAALTGC
jgi:hypothetical protein